MTTPLSFFSETYEEMRKVVWPTRQEIVRLTGMVIIISVGVGLFLGSVDYIFTIALQTFTK